ncbi:MAG: hypothetical protein KJ718_04995 [Nanoarchaeota archaeon]|nr:hypothetical protein [Nanoarchaeota archaeon]MBU1051882.1 hypothetical protein [Nanoarchaeota archaeon]MBU1988241.1 hypothetical protein [Nanoarchaeota archaeon]
MKEITLCGTSHLDPQGPRRLKKLIEKIKPHVITVECLPQDIENYTARHEKIIECKEKIQKRIWNPGNFSKRELGYANKDSLFLHLHSLLYEVWISSKYVQKNKKTELIPVEHPKLKGEKMKEILSDKGFQETRDTILVMILMSPKTMKKYADNDYNSVGSTNSDKKLLMVSERDEYTCKKILEIKQDKILHIGGLIHLFGNYKNLYELLKSKNANVKRIKLIDIDKE